MKNFFMGLVATLLILSLLPLVIYITYQNTEEVEAPETPQEESTVSETTESEFEVISESIPEFETEIKPEPIPEFFMGGFVGVNTEDDDGFKEAIHYMTHQKVYAETQFGAIEVTAENIDKMLSILDRAEYEEVDYYREVLTSWKNGDFSNSVDVHNNIYREQDGNTGFATRLLTPEEEQEFVELNFK